jgi:hypothetical protein
MNSTTLTRTLFPVIKNGCFRSVRVKTSGNVFLGGGKPDSRKSRKELGDSDWNQRREKALARVYRSLLNL